jgi:hypothetical protein
MGEIKVTVGLYRVKHGLRAQRTRDNTLEIRWRNLMCR